jgi:Uncharacterized conserved protein
MIKIICIGKLKETYLKEAEKEYLKRLSKYTKLEIIELIDDNLIKEKERIINNIKPKDNLILLDIGGTQKTSEGFSKLINDELTMKSNITFIIGSSNGVDEEIKKLCNKKISMSSLTFPHQLFRIMLLEQIYRSFKIINNETYHK